MLYANWIYFLGTNQNPTEIFVYGLSLPTLQTDEFSLNPLKIGEKIGEKRLFLFKSVKNVGKFLNDKQIDLSQFYAKDIRKNLSVIYEHSFIQSHEMCALDKEVESPINSLVNITS